MLSDPNLYVIHFTSFFKSNSTIAHLPGKAITAPRIHGGCCSPIAAVPGMLYVAGFNVPLKRRALSELDGFILSYSLP
jgi:hypothetical protein